MRNKTLPLLLAASLTHFSTHANDIEPGKEFYTVIRAPAPIVLDGNLSEWSGVPVLADPKFSIPKGSGPLGTGTYVLFEEYNGGTWTGPDDQTSAVQVVYDADNVYFGFVVTDDYHENAANSAWNGDSIQLMIASADRTAQVALYNYALGGVESALGSVIVQHEAGPGGTEAVVTRNTTTKRTTYEIKLPKASLGLTDLVGGTKFGLGMAINDGDQLTPGQKGWGGLGAHSIVFGKTPQQTALMTLQSYNDIEPGKERYTATAAPNGVALDGSLSEWTGVPVLADPKFSIPKGSGAAGTGTYVLFEEYNGGTWSGPDDQTSAVQVIYDAENVYFGFVVTDDYHENAANSAWNGDSIQLMIASADRTAQVALYNYALGGVETNLGSVIVMHEAGPGGTTAAIVRDTLNNKTIYEIKLPVASLGLAAPLTLGTQFGLGMAINDGDQLTPGQKGWGGLGAHSIVFGKTPQETALITLGNAGSGTALLFLSAVNPAIDKFSFRANDFGTSIVDPATAKLRIDGQLVTLVASPKVLDATDFTYHPVPPPFAAGSHTYSIEIKDTLGNTVTDSGSFVTPANLYPILSPAHQAVSVNTNMPGFIWRVFENGFYKVANLAQTELALAGQFQDEFGFPVDNVANPAVVGIASGAGTVDGTLVRFEIPTVINLAQTGGDINGSFTPDDQMPGIPGTFDSNEGVAAEIITFAELPVGLITMGVTSDDGFRTQAGSINSPTTGLVLAESEVATNSTFKFLVQYAGIYPLRTIWYENVDLAHIEWFTVKGDGSRVLLNDRANGGIRTFRVGVAPGGFPLSIQKGPGGQITITWTEPGTVLQESTDLRNWTDLTAATSPFSVVPGARVGVFYRLKK
jgi:Carbohydrate family 9 binding domain-like